MCNTQLYKILLTLPNALAILYIPVVAKSLKVVDQHTYLEVPLHKSMSWSHHIHTITNEATRCRTPHDG